MHHLDQLEEQETSMIELSGGGGKFHFKGILRDIPAHREGGKVKVEVQLKGFIPVLVDHKTYKHKAELLSLWFRGFITPSIVLSSGGLASAEAFWLLGKGWWGQQTAQSIHL